jgi:hypothetical protein
VLAVLGRGGSPPARGLFSRWGPARGSCSPQGRGRGDSDRARPTGRRAGFTLAAGAIVVAVRPSGTAEEKLTGQARWLAGVVRGREAAALARLVADTGDARPAEVAFT